jgi:hypothetical protein
MQEGEPMGETSQKEGHPDQSGRPPYRVRLPGFVADHEIGLGDVIKHATSYVGIKPCGGCEGRAAALNRRFVFSPWHAK